MFRRFAHHARGSGQPGHLRQGTGRANESVIAYEEPADEPTTSDDDHERLRRLEDVVRDLQHVVMQLGLRVERMSEAGHGGTHLGRAMELPKPRPAGLQAYLLGSFHVAVHGRFIDSWRSQKAASLLKYLLLHGNRRVRRDTLMDVFWPSSSPKAARNNLNVTIYQLRSIMSEHEGEQHVVYRDGSYRLNPALTVWSDAEEYSEQLIRGRQAELAGDTWAALAAYERARELYRGPLLEGDASGEWFLDAQERFHNEHCTMMENLAARLLEAGDAEGARERGEQLLQVDPCRETAHRLMMRCYARLEQPHLVVHQYRRCRDVLRRELAVEPAPETTELFRALVPAV
jgi:DNA-binding SARP family transcriptional activator